MNIVLRVAALAVVTSGCGLAYQIEQSKRSAEDLATDSTISVCHTYRLTHSPASVQELKRRNAMPADEWARVVTGEIWIGMREAQLVCARDYPGLWGTINKTESRSGTTKQYVYRDCDRCSAVYVYVQNGIVTTIQN